MKFKPGDIIKCIDDCGAPLTKDKEYIVYSCDETHVRIKRENSLDGSLGFYLKRFILAKTNSSKFLEEV